MYQRILVPIDGSATSNRGLDEAIALAKLTGASLRLVHMVDELPVASGFGAANFAGELVSLLQQAGQTTLSQGQARVAAAGVPVDGLLFETFGRRLAELVSEQALAWQADLIVIGTHGRRGASRLLLGSDAEQILRTASVPVLLVRANAPGTA